MKKFFEKIKIISKKSYVYLFVTLGLSLGLTVLSRVSVSFSEWHAMNVYPLFKGVFGRVFGIFGTSVAEVILIGIILNGIVQIVIFVLKVVKSKGGRKAIIMKTVVSVACFASELLLIYILNCGINYNRQILLSDEKYGFGKNYSFDKISEEDYICRQSEVFLTVLREFEESGVAEQIQTDENGLFKLTCDIEKAAVEAMERFGEIGKVRYGLDGLDRFHPRPKPVWTSDIMSAARVTGIFSPFTFEANYNRKVPDGEKAVTVLHEMAHVSGFMREEEANFIAFLAALESGNPELVYSAYLYIFKRFWCTNEFGWDLEYMIPGQIMADIIGDFRFWQEQFEDSPFGDFADTIGDVSSAVNDVYLKSQGQGDGVLSYGRVLDLMVVWYEVEY
ncbi:MAG: DUF3810 domain-containing protein [Oscillospiraceae bacterium]|nr:DUF3810 domain-containing protein [Oscillospiraceae bacterium]